MTAHMFDSKEMKLARSETLKELLDGLEKFNLLKCEDVMMLEYSDVTIAEIFDTNHSGGLEEWSFELKQFTYALNMYSPKAYKILRQINKKLPDPTSLAKAFMSSNGEPGFTKQSFEALNLKVKQAHESLYYSLNLAEIQLNPEFDYHNGREWGGTDFGENLDIDCRDKARDAHVFSITCINQQWDLPIAYFFISYLDEEQKANLITICLELLHEIGITVNVITLDCQNPNFETTKILGCNIENGTMNTSFSHPCTNEPIYVFFDPSDAFLWLKVSFRTVKRMKSKGKTLEYKYVDQITKEMEKENDKVKKRLEKNLTDFHSLILHRKWSPSEILNDNVFKSMAYYREKKDIASSHTEVFFSNLNELFYILTSRNLKHYGYRKPINQDNKECVLLFLTYVEDYFKSLRSYRNESILECGPRISCGYIALLVSIQSAKNLCKYFIEESRISSLCLNRFGLFYINVLFNRIQDYAKTNMPSPLQFYLFYEKLLDYIKIQRRGSVEFTDMEKITTLNFVSPIALINATNVQPKVLNEVNDSEDVWDLHFGNKSKKKVSQLYSNFPKTSEFKYYITHYLAGYTVDYLIKNIECEECISVLLSESCALEYVTYVGFPKKKGIIYPSKDVLKLCNMTEKNLQWIIKQGFNSSVKIKQIISRTVLKSILRLNICNSIFARKSSHQYDQRPWENHLIHLMKAVAEQYAEMRLTHYFTVDDNMSINSDDSSWTDIDDDEY